MKFLIWCACVTVCLSGLQLSFFAHDGWRWVWIPILILYFFVGCVLGLLGIGRVVAGKSAGWISRVGAGTSKPAHPAETDKGGGR